MDKLKPVDPGFNVTFQDTELMHKGQNTPPSTDETNGNHIRKVVSHPNEADVALQNLHDAGEKR